MINKYHISKNLYNKVITECTVNSDGRLVTSSNNNVYIAPIVQGITYSLDSQCYFGYFEEQPKKGDYSYDGIRYNLNSFTAPITGYIAVRYPNNTENQMINEGSAPLPYEPYGNTWNPIPYRQYHLNPTSITSSEITTNGGNLNSLTISGNTIQNGTPSPTNIIYPIECGERTKNLYNVNATDTNNGYTAGYFLNSSGSTYTPDSAASACITEYIPIESNQIYSQSDFYIGSSGTPSMCFYDNNKTFIEGISVLNNATFTTPVNASFIRFSRNTTNTTSMFNIGSTTLPYEPYGYKIPITINSNTYNIYLNEPIRKIGNYSDTINNDGSVTRCIKKMVLTGEEDTWKKSGAASNTFYFNVSDYLRRKINITICSHYISQANINGAAEMENGKVSFYANTGQTGTYFYVKDDNFATLDNLKAYLAQQYANETPVTAWYVLNTPTTEQATIPTIPTNIGENTLTIDTALQPSDVKIADWWENKGYGKYYDEQRWIDALYGKYSVGYWENFTISEMEQRTINQLQGG